MASTQLAFYAGNSSGGKFKWERKFLSWAAPVPIHSRIYVFWKCCYHLISPHRSLPRSHRFTQRERALVQLRCSPQHAVQRADASLQPALHALHGAAALHRRQTAAAHVMQPSRPRRSSRRRNRAPSAAGAAQWRTSSLGGPHTDSIGFATAGRSLGAFRAAAGNGAV